MVAFWAGDVNRANRATAAPETRGDSRLGLSGRATLANVLLGPNCGAALRRTAEGGCPHVVSNEQ